MDLLTWRATAPFWLQIILSSTCQGIFKYMAGAALLGDILPVLGSFECMSAGRNFTHFGLYTRVRPDKPRYLVPNDWKSLQDSEFDASTPTKVIIHGFLDNIHLSDWTIKMKNSFLREGDYNVIIVDWTCGNGFPYGQAIENSKTTAMTLSNLILFLKDARQANPANFHLIGHSLGSHIAAIVGHRIPHLGRISGLDPAGPKFYDVPSEQRLDPSDASFVDVIHTDGGQGLLDGLGMHDQVGHVDFYPNGGKSQPGCHSSPFSILQRIGLQRAARYFLTCDHHRAIEYYIESIDRSARLAKGPQCQYIGVQCRDWTAFSEGRCAACSVAGRCAFMGYPSDHYPYRNSEEEAREFYVKTSEHEPFCIFQYQVILETGRSESDLSDSFVSGIRTGVIHLQVKTGSGRISQLKLNERNEDRIKPGKKYVYLATSKFPLGDFQEASVWWGNENKPQVGATSTTTVAIGFKLKNVQIVPITLVEQDLDGRSSESYQNWTFCGSDDKFLRRNEFLDLRIHDC